MATTEHPTDHDDVLLIDGGDRYRLVRLDGRLALVVPGGPETDDTIHLHLFGRDELTFLKLGEVYLDDLADAVLANPDAYRAHDLRP